MALSIAAALAGLVLLAYAGSRLMKARRIRRLYSEPLPAAQVAILKARVPLYNRLPEVLKPRLHGHINYFLHHKVFVGCGGQEIDDTIRLTIAGNACLLVLNRERNIYPGFETILVYPDTFVVPQVSYDGLVETHGVGMHLGESWHRGPVVLSWRDVVQGSQNPDDGHNVVLHEFAHKLDEENAVMDGLPVLQDPGQYRDWSEVLNREFDLFRDRVEDHKNAVIDSYGAESAPEFFAVITETFFEKPRQMHEKLPDLYAQLQRFYQVDPAHW